MNSKASTAYHFDVVTIGSASVDFFSDTDSEVIKIQTRETSEEFIAFPLGSKLLINELNITTGGGGTNTAVAFSRLGFNTGFLGKVGNDSNGDLVINNLKDEGIDFIGPREGKTGLSFILNSIKQDRSILVYKGTNNLLRESELKPFDSTWIFLASMLDQSLETVISLVQKQPCRLAFNPSNYQAELGHEQLAPLIKCVDILLLNKEEACMLLSLPPEGNITVDDLIKELSILPPKLIVVTDGQDGVYAYDGEYIYHGEPKHGFDIVETTGAGDAFASTFTAAQMWGKTIEESIHLAMTNSESVLQCHGAKNHLLSRDELFEIAKRSPREVSKQRAK
jgi:ribokinase